MEHASEFDTTHWTLVAAASGPNRQRALELIYRTYARPLRAYARRFGVPEDDADDVLHDFLLRIFTSGSLDRATPSRGRFRSYLLGGLRHFLAGEWQKKCALKRGGGTPPLSLDPVDGTAPEPAVEGDGDRQFDEEWAAALVAHSICLLDREMEPERDALPGGTRELVFRDQPDAYTTLAAQMGITVPAVKSRIFRLRKRFREIIRREVARTVTDPAEVDNELRYLCDVLGTRWVD